MSVTLSPPMFLQFFDPNNTGAPLAGGKLFTYIAGTSTKQATWTDSTQVTQNNNPIILDANGAAYVWLDPTLNYKFVLSPANDTDPPGSPLRSVDNIQGFVTIPILTAQLLGSVLYPRTATEISLGVTPTNFGYPADPYVDPRRYGADPTGGAVSTVAVQTAINVAYKAKGCVWIGNNCNFLVGALSLTLTGNDTNDGFRITGSSINGSILTQNGSPSALLTLSFSTVGPSPIPIKLENFSLIGTGITAGSVRTCDGLVVSGLAQVLCEKLNIFGFNRCIFLNSTLNSTLKDCLVSRSQSGVYCRTNGAGAPPNMIRIRDCTINGCNLYGVDYDTGSELQMMSCDLEQNGTAATCTGNPTIGSTSATLTVAWVNPSGTYACTFPDGEARNITFTSASTAISWAGGLSATQSAAWIATPTGAIHIGGAINAAPTFGLAKVWIQNCWVEANTGGYAVQMDAPTLGQLTWISIRGGHVISSSNGNAIRVAGAGFLRIEDCFSAGVGDTWNLTATYAKLSNTECTTLIDTGITYPSYDNVTTSGGHFPNGRLDNFTATLTGCTTSPTVNVVVHQQGDQIDLDFLGQITAVSNTTAATLTGLPSKYWPLADTIGQLEIQNNSVNATGPAQVATATGIITLNFGIGFTAANNKGVVGGQLRLRKA